MCIKFRSLSSPQDLLHAVERALNQSSEQWLQRLERKEVRDRLATLTPHEFEVLKCVIAGMLNKQIALTPRGYVECGSMCGVKGNHLSISRFAEHVATHNYSFDMGSNDFWRRQTNC